jgi:cytosine/adenosine deaminase-related metal-dependent hydrolase
LDAAGQRGVICFEVSDRAGAACGRSGAARERALRDRERPGPFALGAMLGLHASFTLADATLEAASDLVRRTGLRVHIHVAEDPVDRIAARRDSGQRHRRDASTHFGLLQPGAIAAHALHLDARRDAAGSAELDVFVAHNARSNMNNGVGRADLTAWSRAGVQVGLGTDGYGAGMLRGGARRDALAAAGAASRGMARSCANRCCTPMSTWPGAGCRELAAWRRDVPQMSS